MTTETMGQSLRSLLPRLWSFAFRLSGTSGLAEDLTGRTLARLADLAKISLSEQITLALALREMYAIWKYELGGTYFVALAHKSSPGAGTASDSAEHRKFLNAVLSLCGLERAAVLLAHAEHLSMPDIALITNESSGRVFDALSTAHFKLVRRVKAERSCSAQCEA
jgi:DNA-directed RNA polymerase specialized sigma24 family protein